MNYNFATFELSLIGCGVYKLLLASKNEHCQKHFPLYCIYKIEYNQILRNLNVIMENGLLSVSWLRLLLSACFENIFGQKTIVIHEHVSFCRRSVVLKVLLSFWKYRCDIWKVFEVLNSKQFTLMEVNLKCQQHLM